VIAHCGFDLVMTSDLSIFHVFFWSFICLLLGKVYLGLLSIFSCFAIGFLEFLIYSGYQPLVRFVCEYFLPFCRAFPFLCRYLIYRFHLSIFAFVSYAFGVLLKKKNLAHSNDLKSFHLIVPEFQALH
jgi:hypothetical protein